jgi:hypothetical protein
MSITKLHDAVRAATKENSGQVGMYRSEEDAKNPEELKHRTIELCDAVLIKLPTFDLYDKDIARIVRTTGNEVNTRLPYSNCLFHFDEHPQIIYKEKEMVKQMVWVGEAVYEDIAAYVLCGFGWHPNLNNGNVIRLGNFQLCLTYDRISETEMRWRNTMIKTDKGKLMGLYDFFNNPKDWNLDGRYKSFGSDRLDQPLSQDLESIRTSLVELEILMEYTLRHALTWFSCRNITTAPVRLDAKVEKARRKKNRPNFSAYTLQIDPSKTPNSKRYEADDPNWHNRLHLARGHVRTYGEDGRGLLFGKYKCKVWIPPHTRGNRGEGVIEKDYEVLTAG